MHSTIDLHCGHQQFVGVELDELLRTSEACQLIEATLLGRRIGRLFPITKGFIYYPPDERWDESRIVERLHDLLKELFGDDYTVSYYKSRAGNDIIMREADGSEHSVEPSRH